MGKKNVTSTSIIPREIIEDHIYLLRKHKVMFDFHLAVLYNVETRALKQQVKRNIHRFPKDFMFELNNKEIDIMVSQFVIPSKQYLGGSRPMVFTEQGVAMLSSVLKSERAMLVNIEIMRTYVKIRQILFSHKELARKIRELELRYDAKFKVVFTAINDLMNPVYLNKGDFGFKVKESKIKYLPKITTTKR